MPFVSHGRKERVRAFSLTELLVVVCVIVLMMSLLLPAITGMTSTSGRRGAVNILMNTFEQARVAALESGQNVYVGFADADCFAETNLPVEEMKYASFIVFREKRDDEMTPAELSDGKVHYVVLRKWTKLPKNIAFKRVKDSFVPMSGGDLDIDVQSLNAVTPKDYRLSGTFPGIVFNNSGGIQNGSSPLQLFLYEGYFKNGQDNFTRDGNSLFEKMTFSRYTGRCQLDVTATGN